MNASAYRKQRDEARADAERMAVVLNHSLTYAVLAEGHGAGKGCAYCAEAESLIVKYHPELDGCRDTRTIIATPTPDPKQPELFEEKESVNVGS